MPGISQQRQQELLGLLSSLSREYAQDERLLAALRDIGQELRARPCGLVWEQHEEEGQSHIAVLSELADRALNDAPGMPCHYLLEGDNLHSLRLLENTHRGRVDLIYIDPPYNTESRAFRYDDRYVDAQDAFRHSRWLSFMNERLRLARRLLAKDGAILLSINENELFVLKCLCDEVFGAENYLTTISVKLRHEDRILKGDKDFHEVTEFLLVYRRSPAFKPRRRVVENSSLTEYKWRIVERTSQPERVQMGDKWVELFKPGEYEIAGVEPGQVGLKAVNIRGSLKEGNSSGRFFMRHLAGRMPTERGYLYKVHGMGADALGYRYFSIPLGERVNGDYYQGVPAAAAAVREIPYANVLDMEAEFNACGYEGGVEFRNGKKPLAFLEYCLEIANIREKRDAIVLDFFAGSGTTGHALLEMNQADGGRRRFILCTNNEVGEAAEKEFCRRHGLTRPQLALLKQGGDARWEAFCEQRGICRAVTYARLCNAIRGYVKRQQPISGIPANLRYFRVEALPPEQLPPHALTQLPED